MTEVELSAFFPTALRIYCVVALITFVGLWFVVAPYGRHTSTGWGPSIRATWAWTIMEMPVLLAFPLLLWVSNAQLTITTALFMAMWMGHYGYRTLIYPWQRRHVLKTYPILIPALAILYNILNGYTNAWYIFGIHPGYQISWLWDPRFVIGLTLFCIGLAINFHSDHILLKLKKKNKDGYSIPNEGLHRYIASPNYLGEIIEWIGWAIATWSPAGLLFAAYTFANLAPRARSNLIWYKKNFPDYPSERKSLVPHLW